MAEQPNNATNDFKNMFDAQFLNSQTISEKKVEDYRTSDVKIKNFESVLNQDSSFSEFIKKTYGSYNDYSAKTRLFQNPHMYDPSRDYFMDVSIITKDINYKTDFISADEIIMENLTGVCSIWFVKNDGNTRKLTCTLDKDLMPGLQAKQRSKFFSPLPGDRVGVWDLVEKKWKSFYASRAFKFVRDDTTTVE